MNAVFSLTDIVAPVPELLHPPRQVQNCVPETPAPISVFKCIYDTGCFAESRIDTMVGCKTCHERSLPLTTACQASYTGHFCSQCAEYYELKSVKHADPKRYECVPCPEHHSRAIFTSLITAIVLSALVVVYVLREQILNELFAPAKAATTQAVIASAWEPLRIIITYAQVAGELGKVLDFAAPEMIKGILASFSRILSVVDVLASAKCLNIDSFHHKWRLQVIWIPVVMMLFPLIAWVRTRRNDPIAALASLTSRSFFVVFFCYPRICRYTFDVFIAHQVAPDVNVLVSDDRVLYEDDIHLAYIFWSWVLIITFCFGVPIGAAALLSREYQRLAPVEPALQARISEAFGINIEDAEAAVNDITLGDKYGFLTAAFKPKFYANESLDMLRKLILVGLILMVARGSVAQAVISLILAVFFLSLQMRNWPYKIDWDNRLRMMTEVHVCLTIAVALAFRTELDSINGPVFGADDPGGREEYLADIADRKDAYDWLLVLTFIICVPGTFIATLVAKMRHVTNVLEDAATVGMASGGDRTTEMKFRYQRFSLGLGAESDSHELMGFLEETRVAGGEIAWPATWARDTNRPNAGGLLRPLRGEVRQTAALFFLEPSRSTLLMQNVVAHRSTSIHISTPMSSGAYSGSCERHRSKPSWASTVLARRWTQTSRHRL
jgi:hypothetical protein